MWRLNKIYICIIIHVLFIALYNHLKVYPFKISSVSPLLKFQIRIVESADPLASELSGRTANCFIPLKWPFNSC